MSIRFPAADDITLAKPPLKQVICQIRYSPILRIAQALPVDFQEVVRARFPRLEIRQIAQDLKEAQAFSSSGFPNEFVFSTTDQQSSVVLGINFVSLVSSDYKGWANFKEELEFVYRAFEQVYGSVTVGRIGLRYVNEIGVEGSAPSENLDVLAMLNPALTTHFNSPFWDSPERVGTLVMVASDEGELLALRVTVETKPIVKAILDYDCYHEGDGEIPSDRKFVVNELDRYHSLIYRAFHWSVSEPAIRSFVGTVA